MVDFGVREYRLSYVTHETAQERLSLKQGWQLALRPRSDQRSKRLHDGWVRGGGSGLNVVFAGRHPIRHTATAVAAGSG
eukprot:COSAG01_NODE_554_length_15534_cov_101.167541_7_plen_79_part_00